MAKKVEHETHENKVLKTKQNSIKHNKRQHRQKWKQRNCVQSMKNNGVIQENMDTFWVVLVTDDILHLNFVYVFQKLIT